MTSLTNYRAALMALCFFCAAVGDIGPAQAQFQAPGTGAPPLWHFQPGEGGAPDQSFSIQAGDRAVLQQYLAQDRYCFRHYCLGGNTYAPGTYLPASVMPDAVPESVALQLATPPLGAVYVRAQGGIYLVDRDSRLILDSVTGP